MSESEKKDVVAVRSRVHNAIKMSTASNDKRVTSLFSAEVHRPMKWSRKSFYESIVSSTSRTHLATAE